MQPAQADAPSLETFKVVLDGAWSNLGCWEVSPAHEKVLKGPFQPRPCDDCAVLGFGESCGGC